MSVPQITLVGLNHLEAREIQKMLSEDVSTQETVPLRPDQHADLGTLNVVVQLAPYAIGVIGLWLLKPRMGKKVKKTIKYKDKNGEMHEETVSYNEYSSTSPDKIVVSALARLFGMPAPDVEAEISRARSSKTKGKA
jgi:hypothetical protein